MEDLEKLPPAFVPKSGKVTAGNASGINDGAAAIGDHVLRKSQRIGIATPG